MSGQLVNYSFGVLVFSLEKTQVILKKAKTTCVTLRRRRRLRRHLAEIRKLLFLLPVTILTLCFLSL